MHQTIATTLPDAPGCETAHFPPTPGFVAECLAGWERVFTDLLYERGWSMKRLAKALGVCHSNVSRELTGETRISWAKRATALANDAFSMELAESFPPLDPRMPRFTVADCDADGDGTPCDPDDVRIVTERLTALCARLSDGHPESPAARRAMGRSVSWLGALVSHMARHADGRGVGRGV